MITRKIQAKIQTLLGIFPAVALLGARQVGKTTLAKRIAKQGQSLYLDLESPRDREKLTDAAFYLAAHQDKLIILDEIQRAPELFQVLRGLIDQGRQRGKKTRRFLLLGSASNELLQQSETLAGRIAYVEMPPIQGLEIPAKKLDQLWLRGGFPDSLLANNDKTSLVWRQHFIRTYLERDIPQLGPRIPAATLHRFWTMLAHAQGGLFNAASLARGLAVDGKTIARYLDLMVDLMLVRRLPPYQINVGKRLVKSPKVYVRDSGVVHALLHIEQQEILLGHPVVGASWEGFVIENLIAAAPEGTLPLFYRTAAGAEIDLILEIPRHGLWVVEIKRGQLARPDKGFYLACEDLKPARRFVVNAGHEHYQLHADTEVLNLRKLAELLSTLEH